MGVASFATAMLAGAGLDALRVRQTPLAPWLATAVLFAAAGLGLRTEAAVAGMIARFGAAPDLAYEITSSVAIAFLYSAAATLGRWLIAAGVQKRVLREAVALPLLVLLVTLDLARANLGAYHTGPSEAVTFIPPLAEAIKAQEGPLAPGRFRLLATNEEVVGLPEGLPRTFDYYGALSIERRQALDVLHNAAFQLESILPQLAGYSPQFHETMHHGMSFGAAARFNVTYYVSRRYHLNGPNLSRMIVAELPSYDLVLFRNPVPPKPRVYLSRKPERSVKPVDPVALFARPDFLSGEVDVIETRDATLPGPALSRSATRPASLGRSNSPTGAVVSMLVGIPLAFYLELWWPGLVLIKSDAYRIWLPIKQHMIERLASGKLPQWFPYEGLGRPFIGIAASGVFHPYTVLYFFLPAADAHRASTLLSCLLAAIGAFTLGRTLNCSRAGALVAGLAFALSGYVVSFTEHLIYLYSICVLPFFCSALVEALTGSRSWAVVPAVIWATVFLNGDIQTGYYYGFIALFWTAMRSPGSRLEATLRVALIGGLAALLSSIQLGPTWVVYVQSQRAQPELFHKLALSESTHPLRLMTVLAAPMTQDADPAVIARLFFGYTEGSGLTESLYLGIPMTGLALIGAWYRRDLRILVLLGGLALLLALGRYGGLYEIFYKVVPLWSAFRYPEKLMGVVSFVVAMLAGAGLDSLRMGKGCPFPWLAVAVLCTGTGLLLRSDAASAWTAASFRAPADLAHEVVGSAGSGFLYGAAVALGVWLIHAGARRGWLSEMLFLSFLITLITLDLARVNLPAYHTGPVETATFAPPLAEALRAREGGANVAVSTAPDW